MSKIIIKRSISASVDRVFKTVSDIREFSKAIPHIQDIEFLSEQTSGPGTRFRETRLMKGREASTELEVTEYIKNERIRLVSDSHGTIWDSLFILNGDENQTDLTLVMDARAHRLLPKLLNPLMKSIIAKAIAADMDAVKEYCEA